jgi:hypothetical protein
MQLHSAWVHTCKSEPRPLPGWWNGATGREQLEKGDVTSRLAQSSLSATLLPPAAVAFVEYDGARAAASASSTAGLVPTLVTEGGENTTATETFLELTVV